MSLEHSRPTDGGGDVEGDGDLHFWHSLIDEREAAVFTDLTPRTLQGHRKRGTGPRFIRISARCIRYTRADLRDWAESLVQMSTSEGRAA